MTARFRTFALAAAAALALSGCAQGASGAEQMPITQVAVGQCFNTDAEYRLAFVVECAEPHRFEVVKGLELDAGAWPGDAAIQERVDAECPDAFAAYTGRDVATETEYLSQAFGPTEQSWTAENDHRIVCIAATANGEPTTGSVKAG